MTALGRSLHMPRLRTPLPGDHQLRRLRANPGGVLAEGRSGILTCGQQAGSTLKPGTPARETGHRGKAVGHATGTQASRGRSGREKKVELVALAAKKESGRR